MECDVKYVYNILNTNVDKTKPWYSVSNNVVYIKADVNAFEYYLEADSYNPDTGRQLYFILSKNKINDSCRKCYVDNFGRIKIKPIAHKEYLKSIYDKDSNIKFELANVCSDYTAFAI